MFHRFIYTNDLLKLYVLQTYYLDSTPIWSHGNLTSREASIIIRPCEYNLNLACAMSFHLLPHLPRLVAMVGKIVMCEKICEKSDLFLSYFIY